MAELRWVLLLLGGLVVGLVWAVGTGKLRKLADRMFAGRAQMERTEPVLDGESSDIDAELGESPASDDPDGAAYLEPEPDRIDRVVTVRFVPNDGPLPADKTVLALRAAGFRHGQYGIFHYFTDETARVSQFSVANLTEPGSFDLSNLTTSTIPGMNFFLILPGVGDPVARFDLMVDKARELARELDADLRDEHGSSWSIQRERYVREEVIEYRHQQDSHLPS